MVLTATLSVLGGIGAGLFALCASVFATAGWTAPACLASGAASVVALGLAITKDVIDSKSSNSGDPDKRASDDVTTFHKVNWDGSYEDYSGRVHELYDELYGTNDTHTVVDMTRGFTHTVKMVGPYVQVVAHLNEGIATKPISHKPARKSSSRLNRRLTPEEQQNELQNLEIMAQKTDNEDYTSTQQDEDRVGRDIANGAWQLGTWCASIHNGGQIIADMGLTLGGDGYEPSSDAPPCMSS